MSIAALVTSSNELLTDEQASAILGVTVATLSIWRCSKRYALPYLKIGRLVRYRRGDLEAWLESRVVRGDEAAK